MVVLMVAVQAAHSAEVENDRPVVSALADVQMVSTLVAETPRDQVANSPGVLDVTAGFDQHFTPLEFVVAHPFFSTVFLILVLGLTLLIVLLWVARARLKETAGSLQRLIASAPVGLSEARVGKDGEPEWMFLSRRGAELIGRADHGRDLTLADFTRNMHPDDLDRFAEANRKAIAKEAPLDVEVRFKVNGGWRWLRVASNPLHRPDGQLVWSGSLVDVTEQREASARFEAIFEQSPVAIIMHDPETGEVLDANPQALREYGSATFEEFLPNQATMWSSEPPYTLERATDLMQRAAQGERLQFDWPLNPADESGHWQRVTLATIRYADQVRVLALAVDITEQRRAEQRLRDSEKRFRTLLDDIEGVAVQGYLTDGSVLYWNRASERLYGYSREEALGSNLLDLIIPQEMRAEVKKNLAKVAEGGEIRNSELEMRTKDGHRVPVYSSHTVLRSPGEEPELFCLDIDLSERKRHEEEVLKAAHYDRLTGLPNRVLLGELMGQAFARMDRQNSSLALCYVDLDRFQAVNDEFGADVGDQVLITVAGRLRRLIRGSDIVSRLGGDEFVIVLEGVSEQTQLRDRLQFLLNGVSRPIRIDSHTLRVEASAGVTLYPQDANAPDVLLRHASEAMLEAKRKGRRRFSLFDPALERDLQQRRDMVVEIQRGLENNEFVLFYQPKLDMANGKVLGLEALARWQHPSRGLLTPPAFLEYLDGVELERQFGEFVITQALAQIDFWNRAGFDWVISVNISGPHLLDAEFSDRLFQMLRQFPSVRPAQLELEILETIGVTDLDQFVRVLNRCRELGIRIALDDFGTGYSSLSRLRTLPIDVLKIDQSFVRGMLTDLSDFSIVKSVIGLAHAFSLEVIAEGVESDEHAVALLKLGCDYGQGYGFARPMPAEAVMDWLERWQQKAEGKEFEADRLSAAETALNVAIKTHEGWLNRLKQSDREHQVGPTAEPADHSRCSLGLWLQDEGLKLFGDRPQYPDLVERHREFHALAKQIADALVDGQQPDPELERRLEQVSAELKRLIKALGGGR